MMKLDKMTTTARCMAMLGAAACVLGAAQPAHAAVSSLDIVRPGATEAVAFFLFASAAAISAVGIAVSQNIVRMATWLFITLGSIAALYFLLAATFLGAVQLIVYSGGTLILIIFGVMLTSNSPWVRFTPKPFELVAAGAVCVILFVVLARLVMGEFGRSTKLELEQSPSVASIGEALLTTYLLPFEIASVLLLVVMIGAAFLARPEKRGESEW